MALSQVFQISENIGGTILYLNDETGEYDAISNPGGYGSPNTERTNLALIVLAKYKASDGDVEITANTYDPESVTQWTYETLDGDGWYQFHVYSIARKTGSETPSTNDFVYDFTANELQRWNGSAWVEAEYSELEDNDVTHATVEHAHIPDLFSAFNNVCKLLSTNSLTSKNDLFLYMMETNAIKEGSLALFTEGNYAEFQDTIEKYQSRVNTLIELT